MAKTLNKVFLLGRMGKDPEIRYTNSGTAICNFSIATSRSYKKDNETKEETQWHRVVIWGKMGEIVGQRCHKGSQIHIEGRMETRDWEDKEGVKRYVTEVICEEFQLCADCDKGDGGEPAEDRGRGERRPPASSGRDSDFPF